MKAPCAFFTLVMALSLALTLGLTGCGKPDEPPAATRAEATPTPTSTPMQDVADAAGVSSDRLRNKADKTIRALNGFLKSDDPRLQAKLQKLADKVVHDKDNWRKKLQEKRDELQPADRTTQGQVARAEGKSREEVDRQLATLEAQSHNTDKKLAELEGATGDAWKKFKARLKEAEAKGDMTDDGTDMPPTPTPRR